MRRTYALLALLALVSTACQIRVDTVVSINEDESGTFAVEMAMDEELRNLSSENGGEIDLADGMDALPPNWSVEDFVDGEFEGVRIRSSFVDIADLTAKLRALAELAEGDQAAPNELIDSLEFSRDGETFTFNARLEQLADSFAEVGGEGLALEGLDQSELLESLFLIRFVVTLPGTLGDNNADSVDGNTMVWVIVLDGEDRTLFAESNPGSGLSSPMLLGLAAAFFAAAAGLALYLRRRGSSDSSTDKLGLSQPPGAAAPLVSVEGDPFSV